jgi:ABC-type transport system involved in multi-copper enzyme maturation permease subunit
MTGGDPMSDRGYGRDPLTDRGYDRTPIADRGYGREPRTGLADGPVPVPAASAWTGTDPAEPPTPRRGALQLRLVRSELIKIGTTNTWWIFAILLVAGTGLTLLLNLFLADSDLNSAADLKARGMPNLSGLAADQQELLRQKYLDDTDLHRVLANASANVFTSGQFIGLMLVVVFGCLIVTNEYFHQTATTTFLATPHRSQVIISKFAAGAVFGVLFWLFTTAIDAVVGASYFSSTGRDVLLSDWVVQRSMLLNLLAFVIWAVLGIAIGVLIRSQLGATISAAVAYLVAVPLAQLFFSVIRTSVIKDDSVFGAMVLVPGVDSQIMVSPDKIPLGPGVLGPPWWVGALFLLGYGLIAAVIGTAVTRRRDIS